MKGRCQISEVRERQRSEVRNQEEADVRYRKSGKDRGQKSEDRSQRSEVRRVRARVGGQKDIDYNALLDKAIKSFERNLSILREIVPVKTICMHGSPLPKWDNRDLWKQYDYRDFGIIAEPYFDINWQKMFYLTDTGRRWDGSDVSVRDKVAGKGHNAFVI